LQYSKNVVQIRPYEIPNSVTSGPSGNSSYQTWFTNFTFSEPCFVIHIREKIHNFPNNLIEINYDEKSVHLVGLPHMRFTNIDIKMRK